MSHQLRLLRAMGLVTGARRGRSVIYSLSDNHVALLLDEAVYHIEHLGLGITDETPPQADFCIHVVQAACGRGLTARRNQPAGRTSETTR